MTISELKEIKKELGWTNAELAEHSGVPISTVAKILGGTTKYPRQNSVDAMARALDAAKTAAEDARSDSTMNSVPSRASFSRTASEIAGTMLRESGYVFGTSAKKAGSTFSGKHASDYAGGEPYAAASAGNAAFASEKHSMRYTIDDYLTLPDDRRAELIDGKFYDMAAPTGMHQTIQLQVWRQIDDCIRRHHMACIAQTAPFDVQIFNDPYTVVQPDIMVFCTNPAEALADRAHSAPDFIAEILSPSTAFRDRTQKLCLFRDAGVKEVWLISPQDQNIEVWLFSKGRETPEIYTFRDSVPLGISSGRCSVDFTDILSQIERFRN